MGYVVDVSRALNEYKTRTCGKTPKGIPKKGKGDMWKNTQNIPSVFPSLRYVELDRSFSVMEVW